MKLLFFDDFKFGVLNGENVVDITDVVQPVPHVGPHDLINGVIARFAEYRGKIEATAASRPGVPFQAVQHRLYGRELHGRRHPG